jgi:cytoskeletal protein RodZ
MLEQEGNQPNVENQDKQSPGHILQEARKAKNITLIDAANELRLSTTRLSNLEENKFSEMGAVTFAKGYLRSYARFLGISEEEVLGAFDAMNLGSDIPTHKPSLINERMTESNVAGGSKMPRRIVYLMLLLVAVAAVFWWHNREHISENFLKMTSPAAAQSTASDQEHNSGSSEPTQGETPNSEGTETYSLPVVEPVKPAPVSGKSTSAMPTIPRPIASSPAQIQQVQAPQVEPPNEINLPE